MENKGYRRLIWIAICLGILFIVICSFPYLFTRFSILDFSNTGQIGDTIGGIMSPFVGIIAAVLTFMAFWIQYKANEEQKNAIQENREELKAQQNRYAIDKFESKLELLLKTYQNCVDNLQYNKLSGRHVFAELLDDLKLTYELVEYSYVKWFSSGCKHNRKEYDDDVRSFHVALMANDEELKQFLTETAYTFFFYGKPYFTTLETKNAPGKVVVIETLYDMVSKIQYREDHDRWIGEYAAIDRKKLFGYHAPVPVLQGYSSQLAPYFRQLYAIVKLIDTCSIPTVGYNEKYDYIKMLRSQMSDEEQALLYYNSISSLGIAWNEKTYQNRQEVNTNTMGLIARYRLIKNLPPRFPFFGVVPMQYYYEETLYYANHKVDFYEHESFCKAESRISIEPYYENGQEKTRINMNVPK